MNNESDHESDPQKSTQGNFGIWLGLGFWVLVLILVTLAAMFFANKPESAGGYRIENIQKAPGAGSLRRP